MGNSKHKTMHKFETKRKRSRVHCQNWILKRLTSLILLLALFLYFPWNSHSTNIVLAVSVCLGRFHVFRIHFVWPPFVATQISRFFAIGFGIFPSIPFSFICSVFNFRCAFICTFVSHQNCLVCAWYFRCFEPWFCVAYFACRQWYTLSVATCHRFFFSEIHNQIYTHRNGKNEKKREKTDRRIEWMIEWDRHIQERIRSQKLSLVDEF